MKTLFIHNRYQHQGGEDTVFEAELSLLKEHGHDVKTLVFDNKNIITLLQKLKVACNTVYSTDSEVILKQKIVQFQPDIIHVHNFFPLASPSIFIVARKYNIPIVMTLHNYRLICPSALLYREGNICELCINQKFPINGVLHGCYRQSTLQTLSLGLMTGIHKFLKTWNKKIDRYITLTSFAKNKFLHSSLNLDSEQIVVKANFVADHGYQYEKDDYCLFIGRLSEEKGIDLLLETFNRNGKKLLIIGTGPLEDKVRLSVKDNSNIEYVGFQSKDFIIDKLKRAKMLVFTSVCYEGMPMTILESLSTATPIICPDLGGPGEIVKNNLTGLLYQSGNIQDLSTKMQALFELNEEAYKKLCKNARNDYEKKYTPEVNYQQLINIYQDTIDAKKTNH